MNRVYKVIWSKAKHCYVVTSEIARSVTKSASSARSAGRKGAAVLAMAALLFTAGGVLGEAANVTDVTVNKPGNVITVTKEGGDPTPFTIDNVDNAAHAKEADYATAATKAYSDGNGLTFEKNYAKVDTDGKVAKAVAADSAVKAFSDGDGLVIKNTYVKKTDAKDNLKVGNDGVISQVTGDDGTTSSAVKTLVLNKDGDNQITMDEKGIKVGKNSTVIASDGVFAGGDTADAAKAALNANGSIKGANGKFTVDTNGLVTANGGVDTNSGDILTRGGKINAGSGDISGKDISASGDISGKDITGSGTVKGHAVTDGTARMEGGALTGVTTITAGGDVVSTGGKVQGTSVSDGTATLSGGSLNNAVDINASGTITGNNVVVKGKLTTNGLETDRITLGSETLNQTDINKGKVTSRIHEINRAVEYTAESIFNKDGSSITVRTNEGAVDSTGSSTVGSQIITQYLGNNAVPGGNNVTRKMIRNNDGTFSMEDKAVYDGKSSTVSQNAKEGIVSETNGGAGSKVTLTQGMNGTYKVETSGTSTEEISGQKIENYKGGLDTNITGNETHDVSENMTTTVTGDSSLTAENITNEAKNKITNKAIDVETDATSSIVQKVTNDAGSNTSTQWSYQTKEEMSQTDGKTASYLRGAVEEKSELIDGDVKTTIDTIAGQTNTNITDGTNTSNDLQKADQIASSVTNGTNKTVVNQDARSLASSITDGTGTKVNNSIHWVDGSAQRIEVDDTHFYAETRTAEKAEEALKSGNTVIDIVKDTNTATVSSAVTDGATITGISQNAKDISLSAAGGTITNDAKDVLNKGTNSVINGVGANQVAVMTDSVKAAYGSDTYTTWDDKGITSNTSGNMSNTVGGDLINTVTGDSSLSATNIKNKASTSITSQIGEDGKVKSEMNAEGISNTAEDGTITNDAKTVKTITGNNTVTSKTEGTTFVNTGANAALKKGNEQGSRTETRIFGNQVETGKVETDFADVNNNLTVGGSTTLGRDGNTNLTVNSKSEFKDTVKMDSTLEVDGESTFNDKVTITKGGLDVVKGGTTTDTLTVTGTSEFGGKAAFKDDVSMGKNLTVTGKTETGILHVNGDGYVGGNLNVEGNIETHDAVLSADSRQVVTGRQLYQTNESVDRLDNRIKKVGANAAALAALRPGDFNPDDKFSIAAGFGSYRNANAAALGLFYRPNENVLLSLGTSFGDGENMVNAGVSVKFGRGKSMAERRKEMADEVSSMRDEMRSQDERIAELEEMLKKQSELIEKLSKES